MNKKTFIKRAAALIFAALFLIPAFPFAPGASAATSVNSVGRSGVYRWRWTYCDTFEKVEKTGFLNNTFSGDLSSLPGDYSLVFTLGNIYYAGTPEHDEDNWWSSGNGSSGWFKTSGETFLTKERNATNVVTCSQTLQSGAAFSFMMYFDNGGAFNYGQDGTVSVTDKNKLSGLKNNGDVEWDYDKGKSGEAFSVYYKNAVNIPVNSDFHNVTGGVRIYETDNTKYVWGAGEDGNVFESKSDKGEKSVFRIWIGHYENVPGLPVGKYIVPVGETMTVDDDVTLIPEGTTLTISHDAVLYVKGTLYLEGYIENYGTIIVEDGGKILIGGNQSYGGLYSTGGGNRNGNLVICSGGTLDYTSFSFTGFEQGKLVSKQTTFYCDFANFTCEGQIYFRNSNKNVSFRGSAIRLNRCSVFLPDGTVGHKSGIEQYFAQNPVADMIDTSNVFGGKVLLR